MPPASKITSSLAARAHIRQVEIILRADRLGNSLDRAIGSLWHDFLAWLKSKPPLPQVRERAWLFLHAVMGKAGQTIEGGLARLVKWTHRAYVGDLRKSLPAHYFRAVAEKQLNLTESLLREAKRRTQAKRSKPQDRRRTAQRTQGPGLVQIGPRRVRDLTGPLRDPKFQQKPRDEQIRTYQQFLFEPPSLAETQRIVYSNLGGINWLERLTQATRLAAPQDLADAIATGYSQGETIQQLAKRLLPVVDGVRSTARRIARTESMRVAQQIQEETDEGLGDLLIGYQLIATMDQHTRPWHALRHGRIYYKDPGPGQKGLHQMPHPPMEPEDASERPPGTPKTAFN